MKETIDWLINVEQLAYNIYDQAKDHFAMNTPLYRFLHYLAEEEANHHQIMGSAAEFIRTRNIQMPGIGIDSAIRERIEAPLHRLITSLSAGGISENQVFDYIIETEFSEWNDIFLYVVNSLKVEDKTYNHAADKIQKHLQHIVVFFKDFDYGREKLEQLKALPALWKGTILIVDDEEAIVTLLSDLLDETYRTDVAHNGEEALALMKQNHYDIVFSDVDMPGLNGIELYQQASRFTEHLERKFIFHTASLSPQRIQFIKDNHLRYLLKPSSILRIEETIADMLRESKNHS